MMAANRSSRTAASGALWLALPKRGAEPPPRSPTTDRSTRAALFAHLQSLGLTPGPGPALSHSGGYVAYASQAAGTAGVDLEWVRPRDVLSLATLAYAGDEASALARLPGSERAAAFVDLWVLKEAAAKALRLDLFSALAGCRFSLADGLITGRLPAAQPWRAVVYAPRPALRLAYLELGGPALEPVANPLPCIEWFGADGEAGAGDWPCIGRGGA